MRNVLVYAEHHHGATRKVTFEMVTEATRVASALGGTATAIAVGPESSRLA